MTIVHSIAADIMHPFPINTFLSVQLKLAGLNSKTNPKRPKIKPISLIELIFSLNRKYAIGVAQKGDV